MDAGRVHPLRHHHRHPAGYPVLQVCQPCLLWLLFFGWEMAVGYGVLGLVWCITIVGIPVGTQCFKMARLALMPFGAQVVS